MMNTVSRSSGLAGLWIRPIRTEPSISVAGRPAIVLTAGIDGEHAPGPRLIQCPRSEGIPIDTLLVEPGAAGGRAPEGAALAQLRTASSWALAHLEAPQETLEKECLGLLERVAPQFRGRVRFARVDRFARAVPAFGVGDYRRLERFLRVQSDRRRAGRRIYFAGDYLADPSVEAALTSGLRAAEAVVDDLGGRAA